MANDGFSLIWRRFQEHPYWAEKRVFSRAEAWIDCWAFMASFRRRHVITGGISVDLERSQFLASDRFLERRWSWSRGKVRRFIAECVVRGELGRVRVVNGGCSSDDTAGGTVYAVVKYEDYQNPYTADDTSERPAKDQRRTKEKEVKERKEGKESDVHFDRFWLVYPKRAGSNPKKLAQQAFRARITEGATVEEIMAGLARYTAYLAATGRVGSEYVMQAKRFVGNGCEFRGEWAVPTKQGGPKAFDYNDSTDKFKGWAS